MNKYVLTAVSLLTSTYCLIAQDSLTITSYNITHAKKNNWDVRKAGVIKLIQDIKADIYGFQEVIEDNDQLKSIQDVLPQYEYVGKPRGSETSSWWHKALLKSKLAQDERCPIFYNKNKLELLGTKTVGINGNNWIPNLLPRIYTMAHFKQLSTGKEFYVYNTHLDHKSQSTRMWQADAIAKDILKESNGGSTILMGDFNTTFDAGMEKLLTKDGFAHAKKRAQKVEGPDITHEKGSSKKLIECDHILIKPEDKFEITSYATSDTMSKTTSDHNPVSMTFSLKK